MSDAWVVEDEPTPVAADGRALSPKGEATRRRLLDAAEVVFAELGWYDASVVKITEAAEVAQGTFYRYFLSKQALFDELVTDLNRRVRRAMSEAAGAGTTRAERERLGFRAFFRFTAEHPALYRIIRQAEFASPGALHLHYDRIASGYVAGLRAAMGAGEILDGDAEVLAWALMGVGEMIGMRWVLWGDSEEVPDRVLDEVLAFVTRGLGIGDLMRAVGIAGTAIHLPRRRVDAAELSAASGIPAAVLQDRFGLRGKHVAGEGEHPSDMAAAAGRDALAAAGVDPADVDAVVYFGSTWKDHPVWQAAPAIAHRLGCDRAFGLELDYVSCGAPVALRVIANLLRAEEDISCVLAVAASRESHLLDYANTTSRFAFPFGDGAVAAVLVGGRTSNQVLGSAMRSDGSLAHHVKVPAGGTVEPASHASVTAGRHHLDVSDLAGMKARLDEVSLPHFLTVAEEACKASGATTADIDHLCVIHMKRSMHDRLVSALGLAPAQATYLEDTGHMSGVDPLLALHRAVGDGTVSDGDLVLLLAAGTGYTWAATLVRWGG